MDTVTVVERAKNRLRELLDGRRKRDKRIDCYEPFEESSLDGQPCWTALDMAIISDLSAFAAVFPQGEGDDELYRLVIRYWLPEQTAKNLRDRVPYLQWAEQGWITLTDGDEVDFGRIKEDIGELSQRWRIQELRYDRMYAAELTQGLELEHGTPRAEFPQTIMHYTLPAKLFERLVRMRRLLHRGNPILTWQLGHCAIKVDNNNNIRPVRPKRGDHRTVDGVQATVMALSGAITRSSAESDWDGTVEYI